MADNEYKDKELSERDKKAMTYEAKTTEDKELLEKIDKRKKQIHDDRQAFEKQWLINIAFLYGKHYFTVEQRPTAGLDERIYWEIKNLERKRKTRRVANYTLPLYRSLLARMLMMKANVEVEPLTNSERDVSAARVAQEVLEDFWSTANRNNPVHGRDLGGMLLVLKKLFGYMLTCGSGWLMPYFNPKTRGKAFLGDEVVEGDIGEVETKIKSPFDVFQDPLNRFIIEQEIMGIDAIEEQYDIPVRAEDVQLSDVEQQLMSLLENNKASKFEDSAMVNQTWELPSKKHPNGRYIVSTSRTLLHSGDLPPEYKGRLPFTRFEYIDMLLSAYPQAMVEQIVSLQEEYNNTISKLSAYKKWFAGKLKVPLQCKLETKYDDEVGQIIKYDAGFGEPHFESPPNPPEFLMIELQRIQRNMEDIVGIHDSSMGRIPSGAKSGVAIENLNEQDDSQMAPVLISIEEKLSHFCDTVLNIVEARYSEPRLLAIAGDTMQGEVNIFKGDEVKGNRRIKIRMGSGMPTSKVARQNFILLLQERQLITAQKATELLEFGDLDGLYHSIDETQAKNENQEMIQGIGFIAENWEDHTIHIKVHSEFMKRRDEFDKLPEPIRQNFIQHRQQHQDALLAEQQAAMGPNTQMPQAAVPQTQMGQV